MYEEIGTEVSIQHEENDPVCLRASVGGKAGEAFYITYRGDREKILAMLRRVIVAFEFYQRLPEKPVEPAFVKTLFGSS